jgi:hypothetical protein
MKIREGFVSNSSTSSFLIYGATMDRSAAGALLAKLNKKAEAAADADPDEDEEDDDGDDDDLYEGLEKALEGTSLEFHMPYDWDNIYIGASWSSVEDNETGAQFKSRIEDELKTIFGKKLKCGTHSEAWHD